MEWFFRRLLIVSVLVMGGFFTASHAYRIGGDLSYAGVLARDGINSMQFAIWVGVMLLVVRSEWKPRRDQ